MFWVLKLRVVSLESNFRSAVLVTYLDAGTMEYTGWIIAAKIVSYYFLFFYQQLASADLLCLGWIFFFINSPPFYFLKLCVSIYLLMPRKAKKPATPEFVDEIISDSDDNPYVAPHSSFALLVTDYSLCVAGLRTRRQPSWS